MNSITILISCRICLEQTGSVSLLEKIQEKTISDFMMEFSNIKIYPDDEYPSSLCLDCVNRIKIALKLKEDIESSDLKLKELIKSNNLNKNRFDSDDDVKPDFNFENAIENFDVAVGIEMENEYDIKNENNIMVNSHIIVEDTETQSFKDINIDLDENNKDNIELNINPDDEQNLANRTCKECGKVLSRAQNLLRHIKVHTGEKPYKCDVCNKTFTQESNLNTHKKIHSGERPYICEVCSKQFVTNICLRQHMITHLPESAKKFKCDECDKAFHDKRHLKRHKIIHDNVKPFVCGSCDKKFHTKFYLSRHHETVHLAIKKHVCTVCDKAFSNSGNLVAHFRIHTGEKPYECKYCDARFNQSTPLVRHTQHHIFKGDQLKNLM